MAILILHPLTSPWNIGGDFQDSILHLPFFSLSKHPLGESSQCMAFRDHWLHTYVPPDLSWLPDQMSDIWGLDVSAWRSLSETSQSQHVQNWTNHFIPQNCSSCVLYFRDWNPHPPPTQARCCPPSFLGGHLTGVISLPPTPVLYTLKPEWSKMLTCVILPL